MDFMRLFDQAEEDLENNNDPNNNHQDADHRDDMAEMRIPNTVELNENLSLDDEIVIPELLSGVDEDVREDTFEIGRQDVIFGIEQLPTCSRKDSESSDISVLEINTATMDSAESSPKSAGSLGMAKVEEIDQNDFIESIRLERNEGFRTNHNQTREGAQQVKGLTKKSNDHCTDSADTSILSDNSESNESDEPNPGTSTKRVVEKDSSSVNVLRINIQVHEVRGENNKVVELSTLECVPEVDVKNQMPSTSASKRQKLSIDEEHLHGPFDFSAHRKDSKSIRLRAEQNVVQIENDPSQQAAGVSGTRFRWTVVDNNKMIDGLAQQDQTQNVQESLALQDDSPPKIRLKNLPDQSGIHEANDYDIYLEQLQSRSRKLLDESRRDLDRAINAFVTDNPRSSTHRALNPSHQNAQNFNNRFVLPLPAVPNQQIAEPEEIYIDDNDGENEPTSDLYSKFDTLVSLFPKVDPEYLHSKATEFSGKDNDFSNWVEAALENQEGLPSRELYDLKSKRAKQIRKFKKEVSVKDLLDLYDDPEGHFLDIVGQTSVLYRRNALTQLKKDYVQLDSQTIGECFRGHNYHYLPTFLALSGFNGIGQRNPSPEITSEENLEYAEEFLKEMQYARKRLEVLKYLAEKSRDRDLRVAKAKTEGQLVECECCRNEECLVDEMLSCEGGHLSCKECIKKASEVAIGDGKTSLICLTRCEQQFSLSTLQKVLNPNFFSRWLQKIQMEELRKADIDGLETCPFCPFATIYEVPAEDLRIFNCLNPDCGKESCRLCKQQSHIPLRCEEVERDDEVRARTFIENKMTEALVRKCNRCDRPYVKMDGCNKITCDNCGAIMCYICRKPVKDYSHFYGQGTLPTPIQTCPLWSDIGRVHQHDVIKGALEAKREIQKSNPNVHLKNDPTQGLDLQNPPTLPKPNANWDIYRPNYHNFNLRMNARQNQADDDVLRVFLYNRGRQVQLNNHLPGAPPNPDLFLNRPNFFPYELAVNRAIPPPAHGHGNFHLGLVPQEGRPRQNVEELRPPAAHQADLGRIIEPDFLQPNPAILPQPNNRDPILNVRPWRYENPIAFQPQPNLDLVGPVPRAHQLIDYQQPQFHGQHNQQRLWPVRDRRGQPNPQWEPRQNQDPNPINLRNEIPPHPQEDVEKVDRDVVVFALTRIIAQNLDSCNDFDILALEEQIRGNAVQENGFSNIVNLLRQGYGILANEENSRIIRSFLLKVIPSRLHPQIVLHFHRIEQLLIQELGRKRQRDIGLNRIQQEIRRRQELGQLQADPVCLRPEIGHPQQNLVTVMPPNPPRPVRVLQQIPFIRVPYQIGPDQPQRQQFFDDQAQPFVLGQRPPQQQLGFQRQLPQQDFPRLQLANLQQRQQQQQQQLDSLPCPYR